jgi:ubiquinone/menaquinone biosynthesis C-methylase UbiE
MRTAEPKNQWQAMEECEEKLWWYQALHGFLLRLLDRTNLPPETRVLDIGCGTGGFMKLLRKRYVHVVGLDLSWQGLTHTRSRGFPSVLMADANRLPFPDNRFDLVVCIDVLEEKQVDPVRLLGEIRRVSKPEGFVLLQASAFQWLMSRHDLAVEASRRFTRPQFEGLAVDQRLTPLYSSYLFTALFPLLALWKLLHPPRIKQGMPIRNDIKMPPGLVNTLLYGICRLESRFIPYLRLPFGTSVCLLARKKPEKIKMG